MTVTNKGLLAAMRWAARTEVRYWQIRWHALWSDVGKAIHRRHLRALNAIAEQAKKDGPR